MKFRKKPVVIEAIQWKGDNFKEIKEFIFNTEKIFTCGDAIHIVTLEGVMEASINDFIIKGVKGEFYPCKPDIFEQTYERVVQ
jgi:hypothetical protein